MHQHILNIGQSDLERKQTTPNLNMSLFSLRHCFGIAWLTWLPYTLTDAVIMHHLSDMHGSLLHTPLHTMATYLCDIAVSLQQRALL